MSTAAAFAAVALSVLSSSKLGVFVQGDDPTSQHLLHTAQPVPTTPCPRIALFPIDDTNAAGVGTQIAAYKAACPGAFAIVQVGGKGASVNAVFATSWTTGGISSANSWNSLVTTAGGTGQVDAVEGPSEPRPVSTVPGATDVADFWAQFALLVRGSGYLPVVGALPPHVNPVTLSDGGTEDAFCATARAVSNILGTGGVFAWSYHARSPGMATGATAVQTEAASTFGYRQIRDQCGLLSPQLFLTEAGPDLSRGGWQASDTNWFTFFEGQLSSDVEVQGAALFEAGSPGSFSLGSVAAVLSALDTELTSPGSPDGGVPDGGSDGGGTGSSIGQGGPPIGGSLGAPKSTGCSTGGPAFVMLALSPLLFFVRRRGR